MIREFHLADWLTLANAVCGTGALFSMMTYLQTNDVRHVYFACGMVFAALAFDVLDGRIARWRQTASALGRELDSLADVISFGVAPAVIAYGCGMQGLYDRVVLAFFVAVERRELVLPAAQHQRRAFDRREQRPALGTAHDRALLPHKGHLADVFRH